MAPKAAEWDGQTFATWIEAQHPHRGGARRYSSWRPRRSGPPSPPTSRLLHVLFYTHSGGGFDTLLGPAAAPSRTASSAARSGWRC